MKKELSKDIPKLDREWFEKKKKEQRKKFNKFDSD
jgi:hypothetical protein